ncbi:MAG TPA: hypothetical protein VMA34_06150 [Terracidiphilus sp.]|nr:hypothetical protein [Terracidiphilus sp.]
MKRLLVFAFFACAALCAAHARAQVVDTDVCSIVKNPASFNGKMVRLKATVSVGFDQFIVRGDDCGFQVNGLWLAYPEGTRAKSGPDAVLELQPAHNFAGKFTPVTRTPVTLQKDKEFKKFDSLLSQQHTHGDGICLGCAKNMVSATLVGRIDSVADATLQRDASGKITGFGGFGNLNAYPARLVLQSVSDVEPKPVDYSKADALVKGDAPAPSQATGYIDPLDILHKLGAALGGSPSGAQAQKASEAFPPKGQENGVILGFKDPNEVSPAEDQLGDKDSPDGVLYNCTLNGSHLQGMAEVIALIHMGQHISELRDPPANDAGAPLYLLESNAWAISVTASIAARIKYLTIPGGYLVWSSDWPSADIGPNFTAAMKDFIANETLLSR